MILQHQCRGMPRHRNLKINAEQCRVSGNVYAGDLSTFSGMSNTVITLRDGSILKGSIEKVGRPWYFIK